MNTKRKGGKLSANSEHGQYSKVFLLCALFDMLVKLPGHEFSFVLACLLVKILNL